MARACSGRPRTPPVLDRHPRRAGLDLRPRISDASRSYPDARARLLLRHAQEPPGARVVAAFADGFAFLISPPASGRPIAAFEPEKPPTRLNDGRTDPQGRFIAGGMDEKDLAPISSVWRLDPDLTLTRLFDGVACANSTCFSPDGRTMYFADSPTRRDRRLRLRSRRMATLGAQAELATLSAGTACRTAPASMPKAISGTRCGRAIASSASRPTAGSTASSRCR